MPARVKISSLMLSIASNVSFIGSKYTRASHQLRL
jgi:hypothetical protein